MVLQATLQPSDTPLLEILRQEIERTEIVAEAISSLVTIGTRVQFVAHHSHWISEGRLTLSQRRAGRSFHLDPVAAWQRVLGLGRDPSID